MTESGTWCVHHSRSPVNTRGNVSHVVKELQCVGGVMGYVQCGVIEWCNVSECSSCSSCCCGWFPYTSWSLWLESRTPPPRPETKTQKAETLHSNEAWWNAAWSPSVDSKTEQTSRIEECYLNVSNIKVIPFVPSNTDTTAVYKCVMLPNTFSESVEFIQMIHTTVKTQNS